MDRVAHRLADRAWSARLEHAVGEDLSRARKSNERRLETGHRRAPADAPCGSAGQPARPARLAGHRHEAAVDAPAPTRCAAGRRAQTHGEAGHEVRVLESRLHTARRGRRARRQGGLGRPGAPTHLRTAPHSALRLRADGDGGQARPAAAAQPARQADRADAHRRQSAGDEPRRPAALFATRVGEVCRRGTTRPARREGAAEDGDLRTHEIVPLWRDVLLPRRLGRAQRPHAQTTAAARTRRQQHAELRDGVSRAGVGRGHPGRHQPGWQRGPQSLSRDGRNVAQGMDAAGRQARGAAGRLLLAR